MQGPDASKQGKQAPNPVHGHGWDPWTDWFAQPWDQKEPSQLVQGTASISRGILSCRICPPLRWSLDL